MRGPAARKAASHVPRVGELLATSESAEVTTARVTRAPLDVVSGLSQSNLLEGRDSCTVVAAAAAAAGLSAATAEASSDESGMPTDSLSMLPAAFLRKERVLKKHADDAPETGVEDVVGLELDAVVVEDEGESRRAAVLLSKKKDINIPKKRRVAARKSLVRKSTGMC